jgi:pimeloyl-ACP methyl ester carboxylesterase
VRKPAKSLGLVLLSLVGLVVLIMGAGLAYRADRQHQNAQALAIDAPQGIDEARFVNIGGIDQWVTIRGRDRDNPVLLFLHGGPGEASNLVYYSQFIPWTKEFTVVQWDQRGAGKTFGTTGEAVGPTMTIRRMSEDGIDLAEYLRKRLHKEKIILVGHSWGSILGIWMAKMRPDLFYAFVGTGQVVNVQHNFADVYERTLERARTVGNATAVQELRSIGPPPWRTLGALNIQGKWAQEFEGASALTNAELASALFAPGYTLGDLYREGGSIKLTLDRLVGDSLEGPMMRVDLRNLGPDFALPVFIIEGPEDFVTSPALAKDYVARLNAPQKEFVLLDAGGHFALFTHTTAFLRELTQRVRPLAVDR